MVDQTERTGLASYLGKYADKVFMDRKPIVETDEYILDTYCRVSVHSDDGVSYQNVPLGPREVYGYLDGDQTKEPVFKGIVDSAGYLVPCHKNEKGDFEIISEDQQVQVLQSAANYAKAYGFPQTIVKTNLLNHETVSQSEEVINAPDGKGFRYAEAYTLTHMQGAQPVGPIEYYLQSDDTLAGAKFLGILGPDGQITPCTRNKDGNFEYENPDHTKEVIKSAKNELTNVLDKYYQVMRTDYFMGRPLQQKMVGEHGSTYTLTYKDGNRIVGPVEYYTKTPGGRSEFMGLLNADGMVVPCTRNADGDFEILGPDQETQVVKSAQNELKGKDLTNCTVLTTDYKMGQLKQQNETPLPEYLKKKAEPTAGKIAFLDVPQPQPIYSIPGTRYIGDIFSDPRAKDKLTSKR